MKAEIIAVGNEVVMGNTINTNAGYIAKQLQTMGIMPKYHTAICDEPEAIKSAMDIALKRAEVVILTGGLGPTKDDLTKEVICEHLNKPLEMNQEAQEALEAYFKSINRIMSENNKKQALFPKDAYILTNNHGTAPGCILEYNGTPVVLLPGPPKEMQPMFNDFVIPYFKKLMTIYYETIDVKLFGIGESIMAERISDLLGEFEWGTVAPYISGYEVIVRIIAKGFTKTEAKQRAQAHKNKVETRLREYVIGYNEDKLEEQVLECLKKHDYTVSTVESCTGGLLAGRLVNCSGISAYFEQGMVTYSNEAKTKLVGVKAETLASVGAVSPETAKEMAEGVKRVTGADIGLSTTGVAGPTGGSKEKPVGLVYIGLALPDQTYVHELRLKGTRTQVREKTVKTVLYELYKLLK
ncbi:competence/damage-inducible protein A [Cellulosilyticum ruminicola]|uniref:competence/damage-inducible protein A n=1 Tax=Cellulosilyticum ruminicola TaxID=425254 RepID=UPI0006D0C2BC|nr:competence/damage-inducible protein A [Cellulosilyticum ruminicola]